MKDLNLEILCEKYLTYICVNYVKHLAPTEIPSYMLCNVGK